MHEVHAYAGKILRVNLSNGRISTEPTMKYAGKFLGGRGINQWILYNEVGPGIWPFDPANRLIFGTGVLVGTLAPGACRCTIDSKNVLTGGVGSSNMGGHFAPELKYAGYDHVVIHGRSRKPVYLWIDNGKVEIRDASDIWGKTTWETDDLIRDELGDHDIQVASIGQAGENLVRAACIITNGERAAGRCGLGAVMGSKNLKAVAVRGDREITVAHPDEFFELVSELRSNMIRVANEKTPDDVRCGTLLILERNNNTGGNTVRNFQDAYWDPEKVKKVCAEEILKNYALRKMGCFGCPLPCSFYLNVAQGEFAGTRGEGFKADSHKDFGPKLDVGYLPAIIKAHVLCSQYGLDVDSASGVIAWAFECYEKGIFTKEDTDGLELEWGNYHAVLELIRKIAFREGVGDLLAEGSKRASKIVGRGSDRFSINIKGHELYESIWTAKAWALGCIVSTRGCDHLRGSPTCENAGITPEEGERFFGVPTAGDRRAYEGKAKLVVYFENFKGVVDCMNICYFMTQWKNIYFIGPEELAKLYTAATGRETTAAELMKIGERIQNLERAFNAREGLGRKNDMPPARFFEPIKSGPAKGERLEREKFERMLDEYYELRGWDVRTGNPTQAKLRELGIE